MGGSSRDRYILAMRQALAPVGHSRNDFDIYRELAAMAGFEQVYTEGRDEMAWIRHIYEQMRPAWEAQQLTLPDFDAFWERGHVALPEPPRDFVLFEQFRADPRRIRSRPPRASWSCTARRWPASATPIARRIRPGCRRRNGWAPRPPAVAPAPCDLPAGGPAAFAAGPVERRARGRDRRPRTGPHASGRRGARGIGQGTWCACTTNAAPAWEAPTWTRAWRTGWWSWPRAPGSTRATRRWSATAIRTC